VVSDSDVAAWVHAWVLQDADLDRASLSSLVVELARNPQHWEHLVQHDPNTRYFHQLYRDPHLDLWLICWLDAQDTGYHDHDRSSGAVYVCEGRLCEDYFVRDADGWIREKTKEHLAGSVFDFDSSYIHGVRHSGGPPATSLHAYSPALWRMGHYELGQITGALGRVSITYADELASSGI
jgi:Cysteine dioxygenase type I